MIYFMVPDLPSPSGGVRVIYGYAARLTSSGRPASVWHGTPGFGYAELAGTADAVTGPRLDLEPGDVLVMPEVGGSTWSTLAGDTPVVMLCQGVDFVFADADFGTSTTGRYPGWPTATAAVATSDAVAAFLEMACTPGFPVHHVPVEIDSDAFRPLEKQRRIALMPRRRREDLLAVTHLVRRSGLVPDWELEIVDNLTSAQVADALGRSAIFLSGAEREGFGLPGAEAMAAGCYVIGFTGDGAKEYMRPECSAVVPESDVVTMARLVIEAAQTFEQDRARFDERVALGRDLIRERYSREAVVVALTAAFDEICAPGSPSVVRTATTVPHYQTHAPRPGAAHAAYRQVRHVGRQVIDRWHRQQ